MTLAEPTFPAEFRPAIDWSGFLQSAPYFASALMDRVEPERAADLAPLPRAAWYFDIFNGELSNGGVMQYFYNQAMRLPGFERIPEFIAAHPALAGALPFVEKVHAAWDAVAPAVREARESDDWPEDLFQNDGPQFEALQLEFFAVNHALARGLECAIVQAPQDYFDIEAVPGLPAEGIAHIKLREGTHRLRFQDGFPVGPNLLEKQDGTCDVVWFTGDRQLMEVDRGRSRDWIHYPSMAGSSLRFKGPRLQSFSTQRALWQHHGIHQYFRDDGSVSSTEFKRLGQTLLHEYQYPGGMPQLRVEPGPQGKRSTRYWPSGGQNTVSVEDRENQKIRQRFLSCLDEAGAELAPGGNGQLLMMLTEEKGKRSWLKGQLVDGLMQGEVTRIEQNLATGELKDKPHGFYNNGFER